jgi:hypothetical protein
MTGRLRSTAINCLDALVAAVALARPDTPSTTLSPASTRPISGSRPRSAHVPGDPRLPSTDYAASFLDPSEPAAERSGLRPALG